ncbi:MAG: tyrosine-type recombinase/integrase [Planctomycetaceae bacterium]
MKQLSDCRAEPSTAGPRLSVFDPVAPAAEPVGTRPPATAALKEKRKAKSKDFPLWYHGASGRWCRTIKGTRHYFGTDKEAALNLWLDQKDDLLAGRIPRSKSGGFTLADLCNEFLTAKKMLVDSGELSPRTFGDYKRTTDTLIGMFGKNRLVSDFSADDFAALRASISKTRGLVGLSNAIRLTRIVFKYAYDVGKIEAPVRFGPLFKVKRESIRKAASGRPARMFEAVEIRRMLEGADDVMQAMILVAINCGFGQTDLANLPKSAVDLDAGLIIYPRVKTGVPRRVPLWPETVTAIRKALMVRPEPKDPADADLVFVMPSGRRWTHISDEGGPIDSLGLQFSKLLTELKLKRKGLSFYALRHVFATIASDSCDQVATNAIMGHLPASDDMPGRYRERVADERLRKVVDHVRAWLFPKKPMAK